MATIIIESRTNGTNGDRFNASTILPAYANEGTKDANEKFFKTETDTKVTYYKSCVCGQVGTETFDVTKEVATLSLSMSSVQIVYGDNYSVNITTNNIPVIVDSDSKQKRLEKPKKPKQQSKKLDKTKAEKKAEKKENKKAKKEEKKSQKIEKSNKNF